jgi:hypothetical protein
LRDKYTVLPSFNRADIGGALPRLDCVFVHSCDSFQPLDMTRKLRTAKNSGSAKSGERAKRILDGSIRQNQGFRTK